MLSEDTAPPLSPQRLAEIRARSMAVRAAFGPGSQPSEDEPAARALFANIVTLLRDDMPLLLYEIERLRGEVTLCVELLKLEA